MKKAIFLDRDGVINHCPKNPHKCITSVDEINLHYDAVEMIPKFKDMGFLPIVVTNQSGIGRGLITIQDIEKIHNYIKMRILGISRHFYFCPHLDNSNPNRKPNFGMILQAKRNYNIDLSRSYMIGDSWKDILCAHRAGVLPIFLKRGQYEESKDREEIRDIWRVECDDLFVACQIIQDLEKARG